MFTEIRLSVHVNTLLFRWCREDLYGKKPLKMYVWLIKNTLHYIDPCKTRWTVNNQILKYIGMSFLGDQCSQLTIREPERKLLSVFGNHSIIGVFSPLWLVWPDWKAHFFARSNEFWTDVTICQRLNCWSPGRDTRRNKRHSQIDVCVTFTRNHGWSAIKYFLHFKLYKLFQIL